MLIKRTFDVFAFGICLVKYERPPTQEPRCGSTSRGGGGFAWFAETRIQRLLKRFYNIKTITFTAECPGDIHTLGGQCRSKLPRSGAGPSRPWTPWNLIVSSMDFPRSLCISSSAACSLASRLIGAPWRSWPTLICIFRCHPWQPEIWGPKRARRRR